MTISEMFSLTGKNPFPLFTIIKDKDILSLDVFLSEGVETLLIEEENISHPLLEENEERRRAKKTTISVLKSRTERSPEN